MSDRDKLRAIRARARLRQMACKALDNAPCPECEDGTLHRQAMGWAAHRCDSCGKRFDSAMMVP